MNDHETPTERPAAEAVTAWQTPEYEVVETALEVTAYRRADR
ncbi:pyrroloquinoline quinone precursor peptide PqqA [Streptomyces sp. NPDC059037]